MTTAVQPEKILKELQALWVDLGKQNSSEAAAGVLRACSMTLIVVTDGPGGSGDVGETLGLLMRENPSRAIVLRIVDGDEPKIEARVFAQCWMPFGRRQQICCEQIEVSATVSRLADAYSAMLGLTVPDLPVILWQHRFAIAAEEQLRAAQPENYRQIGHGQAKHRRIRIREP